MVLSFMRRTIICSLAVLVTFASSFSVAAGSISAESGEEGNESLDGKSIFEINPKVFNEELEEVLLTIAFDEQPDKIEMLLFEQEDENPFGIIAEISNPEEEVFEYKWDLSYLEPAEEEEKVLSDGHYYVQVTAMKESETIFSQEEEIFMHSTVPQVELNHTIIDDTYQLEENFLGGHIQSYFAEAEHLYSDWEISYTLSQGSEVYNTGSLTLTDNSQFDLTDVLVEGLTELTLEVQDPAQNIKVETFLLEFIPDSKDIQTQEENELTEEEQAEQEPTPAETSEQQEDKTEENSLNTEVEESEEGNEEPETPVGIEESEESEEVTEESEEKAEVNEQSVESEEFGELREAANEKESGEITSFSINSFEVSEDEGETSEEEQFQVMAKSSDIVYQDGDDMEEIVSFKQKLTRLGFGNFPDVPSTRYGSVTMGVVEDFQSYYGLEVTGTAVRNTVAKMEEILNSPYSDGQSGPYIVDLKLDLTALGFGNFPSSPSENYGPVTEGVVRDFQEANSLTVNGIADEVTLATIASLLPETEEEEETVGPQTEFSDGDSSEAIRTFKQNLTRLGFGNFPEVPSTRYGPVTMGVVEDFQSYYGLEATGTADQATIAKMEEILNSPYSDGQSGPYIVDLKLDLTALGFGNFPSSPSQNYGPVTEGVVREFQAAHNLAVNGIADEVTLATIASLLPETEEEEETVGPQTEFRDGDSSEAIRTFKQKLTRLGFGNFPEIPSPNYGPVTEGVVEDFQEYYGLPVTGVADQTTIAKVEEILNSPYSDGQSGDYIVKLKKDLTLLGFGNFPSSPSQNYGPVTEGVVSDFQKYYGLPVTGTAEEKTFAKMEEIFNSPYRDGQSGSHIVKLKEDLTLIGFGNFPSSPSQNYGPVTEGVVREFQAAHNLAVNGIADEVTLAKIQELRPLLYQDGESGEHIVKLKKDLTRLGFGNFPSSPSQNYGSVTEGVVKDFQRYYGLSVTGIGDERTLRKIEEIFNSPYSDGQSGNHIVTLKKNLTDLGFGNFPSSPSINYGSVTAGVVRDFQRANNLRVNGIADEVTLAKIEELLAELPAEKVTYTQYDLTLQEALERQLGLNPPPQTDRYSNAPSFIRSDALENVVERGVITGNPVNIRTQPTTNSSVFEQVSSGTPITILEEVRGQAVGGDDRWYKIEYKDTIVYVHKPLASASAKVGTVKENRTPVRESSSNSSHVFTHLSRGTEVVISQEGNTWHQITYPNSVWRNAKPEEAMEFLDPSKNDRFQHLVLDSSTGLTVNQINGVLSGRGVLDGMAQVYINAGQKHSVNEIYLIAHSLLETGNGTSQLATGIEVGRNRDGQLVLVTSSNRSSLTDIRMTYNMFGIGANDHDPYRLGAIRAYNEGWHTPEAAIIGGASFISNQYFARGQNTVYKMRWNHKYTNATGGLPQYATDMGWAVKQVPRIKQLYDLIDNPTMHFDIVQYR